MYSVQIEHIGFEHCAKRGEDGAVWYLLLAPCEACGTDPTHHSCAAHPGMIHAYERQPFRRGTNGHRLNATPEEIADDRANVWGWDGSTEQPTLTPSFLAAKGRPYVMHSFLRGGRLELCGDSTVALAERPTPCTARPTPEGGT